MLSAFQSLGFQVDIVAGTNLERKKSYQEIRNNIKNGDRYLFCYSESSTLPTLCASGKKNFFSAPIIDYQLFLFLFFHKIPLGLFLRDIYWRFNNFRKNIPNKLRWFIYILGYWCDVIVYYLFVDTLYVPSVNMIEYLPNLLRKKRINDLPPGMMAANDINEGKPSIKNPIKYIYTGGIGHHYRMDVLFQAVRSFQYAEYYVCCRKKEWEEEKIVDIVCDIKNIFIFHYDNEGLPQLYTKCHIGLIFIEPIIYWEFAMPYKLFEYLSYGKPVIASEGTAAGDFVRKWGVGWVIPYERDALIELFIYLSNNQDKILACMNKIREITKDNLWETRALTVKNHLLKKTGNEKEYKT
jgi:glycosyltransferase involved in cell wall biosynthesis